MTAYHLLAGRPAFPMSSIHALIYKHVNEAPPPLREIRPDIPVAIAEAIARALAKDPAARFPTMEAFATAIWPERPVAASGTSSTVVSASAARQPARRPALRWLMAAGLVVVLGVRGGFLLKTRGTGSETPAQPARRTPLPWSPPQSSRRRRRHHLRSLPELRHRSAGRGRIPPVQKKSIEVTAY